MVLIQSVTGNSLAEGTSVALGGREPGFLSPLRICELGQDPAPSGPWFHYVKNVVVAVYPA